MTPGLPQKEQLGRALNSYVVASSVGNLSVRDLEEPVQIHIAHLDQQVEQPSGHLTRTHMVTWSHGHMSLHPSLLHQF